MREIRGVRQRDGEPTRRWFTDEYWDLFVWHDRGDVVGFQLCYGKPNSEHSLTWRRESGFASHAVDDGEGHPSSHRTPILVPDGDIDAVALIRRFVADSTEVDPKVRRAVVRELQRYRKSRQ
jgi:hypothetical protein